MNNKIFNDSDKILVIDPYTSGCDFQNFVDLKGQILEYYDKVYDTIVNYHISPRYFYETGLKIGFWDIFYYINRLYDNNPETVIDVGCGECIWKKWFPNITGFDPNTNEFSQQDFVDFFDEDFSKNHYRMYDCGMALNSLHFISWNFIPKQIELAMNIVKKRFLFTFNFNVIKNSPNGLEDQIKDFDEIIRSLNYEIVLIDYPFLRGINEEKNTGWAHLNGNVRFILQHRNNTQ
jgi:hypothetical protein